MPWLEDKQNCFGRMVFPLRPGKYWTQTNERVSFSEKRSTHSLLPPSPPPPKERVGAAVSSRYVINAARANIFERFDPQSLASLNPLLCQEPEPQRVDSPRTKRRSVNSKRTPKIFECPFFIFCQPEKKILFSHRFQERKMFSLLLSFCGKELIFLFN